MPDLVIVGAGGHGREILQLVRDLNCIRQHWRFLGFIDDGPGDKARLARIGARVIGTTASLPDIDAQYVIGIGDSTSRERVAAIAQASGREPAVLVHPTAVIGADVDLSPGSVICAGAQITTNVRLGEHTHVNVSAVVSHDCRLGKFVTLSPGAFVNGTVTLRDHVLLGTSAVVTPGRTVGAHTWVGAGAVVVHDLPDHVVATGVPARVRRTR